MELEGDTEAEREPFADLAERLGERGDDPEAAWDAFAERADQGSDGASASAEPATGAEDAAGAASAEPEASAAEPLEPSGEDLEGADEPAVTSPPTIDAEPVEPEAAAALDELIDEEDERLAGEAVRRVAEERTYVVPKADFCETCEHFSAPPEMACGNEGTELVEFEDMEHVRVRDCPVVEERQAYDEIR